jgi:glycosyltransferase involved in cell wall biosynthesis
MSKKILVVGMLDSIHFCRWLEQFKSQDLQIVIFPSKIFRNIHPNMLNLINNDNFIFVNNFYKFKFSGYIDFILSKCFKYLFRLDYRIWLFNIATKKHSYYRIHALEIQGAGYLCLDWKLKYKVEFSNNLIVTNWGSDIYFFMQDAKHLNKIKKVLSIASFYSAECTRDYDLAVQLGFTGKFLPCNPNSGGVIFDRTQQIYSSSERDLLLVKGYGGSFGQASLAISAINNVLSEFPNLRIFYYSVTKDVEPLIIAQKKIFMNDINYAKVDSPLSYEKMLSYFKNAKIYLGISRSDGISTSFLEALSYGAYPIQSNSSCANEWVDKGIQCTLVDLSIHQIENALRFILKNPDLLDLVVSKNLQIATDLLNYERIASDSLKFYQ